MLPVENQTLIFKYSQLPTWQGAKYSLTKENEQRLQLGKKLIILDYI